MTSTARFDGAIAGVGTASGTRLVLGVWPSSPFGFLVDAMVERPDGHRILIAPGADVARYIAATYHFDEVRVEPTALRFDGSWWTVSAASLQVSIKVARRTGLGWLLALVPRVVARRRAWCRLVDPLARLIRPGVSTHGTAGGGRHEWYCALDEHAITGLTASWEGADLGALRAVRPPVRFGFGSTPARPSLVRVTTFVDGGPMFRAGMSVV